VDVPTVTITVPAWLLSALGPSLAVLFAWWLNHRQLTAIHHDTNSALSDAKEEIVELKAEIQRLRGKRS
jgi:hypothetical protein